MLQGRCGAEMCIVTDASLPPVGTGGNDTVPISADRVSYWEAK